MRYTKGKNAPNWYLKKLRTLHGAQVLPCLAVSSWATHGGSAKDHLREEDARRYRVAGRVKVGIPPGGAWLLKGPPMVTGGKVPVDFPGQQNESILQ